MKLLILVSIILTSCFDRPIPSKVSYSTPELREQARQTQMRERLEQERQEQLMFEAKKEKAWIKIEEEAKESYQDIANIISYKCSDCHDENKRLPLYGRVLRTINPVFQHQKDGLKAFDFSQVFPMKSSDGYTPNSVEVKPRPTASNQISFLKAIKEEVINRSMPIRSYTRIYRYRKVFNADEAAIVAWVDPLIEKLEFFKEKYEADIDDGTMAYQAKKIFEAKCYRCHANGSNRGGFGNMQDLKKLAQSKYINLNSPTESELYQQVLTGEMPTNASERLTAEELSYVLEWIVEASK